MLLIKIIILGLIFAVSSILGLTMANRYKKRVNDLKMIFDVLNIIETKIRFIHEPLPQIFDDVSIQFNGCIGNIFKKAKDKMNELSADEAWIYSLRSSNTFMKEDDLLVLKGLGKALGKADVEGEISEIEITKKFIETQIQYAEEDAKKNEKMCKNLGITIGLALVIILI